MRAHIEMEVDALARSGVAPDEARRQALAAFGGTRRSRRRSAGDRATFYMYDVCAGRRRRRHGQSALCDARGWRTRTARRRSTCSSGCISPSAASPMPSRPSTGVLPGMPTTRGHVPARKNRRAIRGTTRAGRGGAASRPTARRCQASAGETRRGAVSKKKSCADITSDISYSDTIDIEVNPFMAAA